MKLLEPQILTELIYGATGVLLLVGTCMGNGSWRSNLDEQLLGEWTLSPYGGCLGAQAYRLLILGVARLIATFIRQEP